ncbi:MFS transporter [Paenibacillus gallinarum]|uniref:MFS transporter n=1 Tax=Paenibacillus gallinarum TaxID=2762232 RepID=A0ABR8T2G9_9BACL|nr:MFS transporter [Paenibacillus gallinarum]MBD7969952.1 MFS transporter [Paenibacillus gallinarum]
MIELETADTKERLWTKDFLIVFGVNFLLFLCFYLLVVIIPSYAIDEFHVSDGIAALGSSIFVIGALIGRIAAGRLMESVGRRRMLFTGLIFFTILSLGYFFISSITTLLIIRFFHGLAFALASTATGTISASLIPHSRRGEGTGYYGVSIIVASAIGPFLGVLISNNSSVTGNFILCAVLAVFSLFAGLFLNVPKLTLTAEQKSEMKGFKISNFFEPKAIPISITILFMGLAYSSILSYLKLYAGQINLTEVVSFFFIVYAVVVILTRPFTGKWFDKHGVNFVMYPAIICFIIAMILLSQVHSGLILLLSAVFVGLGYGTTQASAQAYAVKKSPVHRMGLATSTFYIFLDLGIGVGPFLLGFLTPFIGYRGMYMVMAGLLVVSFFVYYVMVGRKEKAEAQDHTLKVLN